jgi:F-box-like
MASIGDLPVELLLTIFKLIYDDDDMEVNNTGDDFVVEGGYPEHSLHASMCQMEDDLHNPTLFPMTIAFVCHYWRDILAKSPEYWNKVVFDVGRDPTPLLDAFSWSNDQLLDVLVWNRIPDLTAAGKALENGRVSAITQSLTPHFHRCCRIRYEVTYSSSLPPISSIFWTKPYILRQFVLEPRVDDIQYDHSTNLTSMEVDDNALLVTPFSSLSVLSLGGRLFIDLGRAGWLHNLRSDVYLTLTISQFRFQQQKGCGDDGRYTLLEFLNHLAAMPQPDVLRLRNLSLLYEPGIPTTNPKYSLKPSSLCLDNLGENILTEFFEKTILSCDSICINRCTIPWIDCSLVSTYLYLDNIGYIHNISNILWVWQGSHLSLDSCAAFDDDLLDRLEDEGRNWCLKLLTDLTLKDCINFTSAGLRKLMMLQRAMAAAEDNQVMLDRVSVEGGRLSLWEDDISWFRQQRGSTEVSWTIIHPDGTFAYPLNHYRLGED